MESSMNVAIKQNNLGVSFLQKGRHEEALLELKKAAQLMYKTTQELKEKALTGTTSQPCHISDQHESHACSVPTNNSFIRSTPLLMSYNGSSSSSCTVESAIVLMNMALCYHLDSTEGNTMPDAMQNALTLYRMSYSLGVQAQQHDERAFNLILTSLNNMGQLHHEMGDFDKSRLYLEDLSTYVTFVNQRGHLIEDRHEFMLNAMVLRNPNSCAGAA